LDRLRTIRYSRFIAKFKPPFKILPDHPHGPAGDPVVEWRANRNSGIARREVAMARYDVAELDAGALGEAPATADVFFELGMNYAIGRTVPVDFVSAHKWFNIAALRGNRDAARLRREIAEQMSECEIAAAQRAARAWLTAH
jgi:uncharacterized protein